MYTPNVAHSYAAGTHTKELSGRGGRSCRGPLPWKGKISAEVDGETMRKPWLGLRRNIWSWAWDVMIVTDVTLGQEVVIHKSIVFPFNLPEMLQNKREFLRLKEALQELAILYHLYLLRNCLRFPSFLGGERDRDALGWNRLEMDDMREGWRMLKVDPQQVGRQGPGPEWYLLDYT